MPRHELSLKWLTPPISLSIFVFLLMAGTSMGALALLQFTDWDVAFYILASIPLPISMLFLIFKIFYPALDKSKSNDKNVSVIAFILYYFSTIIGWAMIWMIIWHVKPNSYNGIDTFDPKDAYNTFGYVLIASLFVSLRTAPAFVLPEGLISTLVSGAQICVAWIVDIFIVAFIMKIIFERFDKRTSRKSSTIISKKSQA